jgi:hypothetical protein
MSFALSVTKSVLSVDQAADVAASMEIEDTTDLGDALIHVGTHNDEQVILISTCGGGACLIKI